MTTVGSDPGIFWIKGCVDPGGDGFLSIVEMAESADVFGFVFVVACDFHSTHGVHEAKVIEEFFLGHCNFIVGCCVEVMCLVGKKNH